MPSISRPKIVPFLWYSTEMMADTDRVRAKRAADAMMKMVKIDIAALRAAYTGRPA